MSRRKQWHEREQDKARAELVRKMFPLCIGTTQLAPTNRQCMRCERYGQHCDWKAAP